MPTVAKALDRVGISERVGADIVSVAFQNGACWYIDDENKIWHEKTKSKTPLSSKAVVKYYNNNQFDLCFDGRKDRAISVENNRKKSYKKNT